MTNLTLDSYGVLELNEGEMVNVNGGLVWLLQGVAAGLVTYVITEFINDAEGHIKAFQDGYNLARS